MKKNLINFVLPLCNWLALQYINFYLNKKTLRCTEDYCAILSDYLNTTLLIDSVELSSHKVWLVTTERYNFYNLLLKGRYKKLAGLHFVHDYSDSQQEALLEFCKSKNIQYVFLQSGDFMVPMVNYLNRHLNNKGTGEFGTLCSLDKSIMRGALNKHGLGAVRTVTIKSKDDLNQINYFPVVLKPAIGTASEGVQLVENEKQLVGAYKKCMQDMRQTEFNSVFLAEEYIVGRQFDVEGVILNGEVKIICIVEENYEGFFPNFDMNWYLFNAIIPPDMRHNISETVSVAFKACEIKHGAFHCELRVTEDGAVKIIELSNRMGGSFEQPISELTGTNFCDAYLQSVLDKPLKIKNKNQMMLDKYFKDKEELIVWQSYLKSANVQYKSVKVLQPNNKFKLSLRTYDKEVIYRISEHFNLGIVRV